MRNRIRTVFLGGVVLGLSGCICDRERFRTPDWLHPGHISEQRSRMEQFDPFTRADIGPKIEGDRPHGTLEQKPAPEHLREYSGRH